MVNVVAGLKRYLSNSKKERYNMDRVDEHKETREQVRNVLSQYRAAKAMCNDLALQIAEADERMTSVKSPKLSAMPRGGTAVTIADMVADKDELISRKLKFDTLAKQKREIVQSYIDTVLSVKHNRMLTMHFINCMSIYDIAKKEHYSERHAFRVYKESLLLVDLSLCL